MNNVKEDKKYEVFFTVDFSDLQLIKNRCEIERLSVASFCRNLVMKEVLRNS